MGKAFFLIADELGLDMGGGADEAGAGAEGGARISLKEECIACQGLRNRYSVTG